MTPRFVFTEEAETQLLRGGNRASPSNFVEISAGWTFGNRKVLVPCA